MKYYKAFEYKVWAAFDTETSNISLNPDPKHDPADLDAYTHAYPILYIFNDFHNCDLYNYEPDCKAEVVTFLRYEHEAVSYIEGIISAAKQAAYVRKGKNKKKQYYRKDITVIPILCVYNCMFDMQTLMETLHDKYFMKVSAATSSNVYTIDLYENATDSHPVLRVWDTFHLEMGGLKAMGITCGVDKLMGDWDYDLVRTPETVLTDEELGYAKRDVQVIPAYLRYLLRANDWMHPDDLGFRVLTKTSLVRQMAKRKIGNLRHNGNTLGLIHERNCFAETAPSYDIYALRRACFRGGLTFTAAATASTVVEHVCSLDVTSMHHAFLNGQFQPVQFKALSRTTLQIAAEDICRNSVANVLYNYHNPFGRGVHLTIEFHNIHIKKGTAFEAYGIATLAQAKFERAIVVEGTRDESVVAILADLYDKGWHDESNKAVFAFSKLYSAESVVVNVTEYELWLTAQVYEWDEMVVLGGECTTKFVDPPMYVSLQSNLLFELKDIVKAINEHYQEGVPYDLEISNKVPASIAKQLKDGTLTETFLEGYYKSSTKGMFNSIYGSMAQDLYKPEMMVNDAAEIVVDPTTKPCEENYEAKSPEHPKVMYNYGMRIVGASRVHLALAIMLIWERFGHRVDVLGGDTDSVKIRCDDDVTPEDVLEALEPLHQAIENAMNLAQYRIRQLFPSLASDFEHVGKFEVEPATKGGKMFYDYHMEAWNKARVSVVDGHCHITCAGLPRPKGTYNIESFIDDMLKDRSPYDVLPMCLGYDVIVNPEISHTLEHHKPHPNDRIVMDVTDYQGNTTHVDVHEAVSLYPAPRAIGETLKLANAANVSYIRREYGRQVNTKSRVLGIDPDTNEPHVYTWGWEGLEVLW